MARGMITDLELPERTGRRGRPQEYINAEARLLHARLIEVERLLGSIATTVGFEYEAEKRMRARLFALGNAMNANVNERAKRLKREKGAATRAKTKARKAAAARENPADQSHALLLISDDGEHVTVCGFRPVCYMVGDFVACDTHITECPELVGCPDCLAAL